VPFLPCIMMNTTETQTIAIITGMIIHSEISDCKVCVIGVVVVDKEVGVEVGFEVGLGEG
jgi:hypothetical protein